MIEIAVVDAGAPTPRPLRLTLSCDGDHGLFPVAEDFEHADGMMGAYRLAMNRGWKDTSRNGRRVFFGPCCSGKAITGQVT